jgi:hypothetical protein
MQVEVEVVHVPKRQLDLGERRTRPKVPRARGDASIEQRIRVVWSSGHDDLKLANGHDGAVEVVGLKPLAIRDTDEDHELDWIHPVGPHEASETTNYVEPGVPCHCRTFFLAFGLTIHKWSGAAALLCE